MRDIVSMLMVIGTAVGIVLGALLSWQALLALCRLVLAAHATPAVSLLLDRLSGAVREGRTWEPVLRGMRLELPWPWPWRLGRAADRLAAGVPPAEVLASSALLPAALRPQAAQALQQGPESFDQWCIAIADREGNSSLAVRQQAFLLAEGIAVVAMLWFLSTFILPKFEWILRDLGLPAPPLLAAYLAVMPYAMPLLLAAIVAAMAGWSLVLAMRWRRRRRQAAARLLLAGCQARLPEAALGPAEGFAELCVAAGWQAADPADLARRLADEERREALRHAWLPSLVAAVAPVIGAVPIGIVVIGIMQLILSLLASVEVQP